MRLANTRILFFGVIALSAFALIYVKATRSPERSLQHRVRFAVPVFQSSALVLLAQEQDFFGAEKIDASFEYRPTGKLCLDLVIQGKADFAVVYETPVMHATLAGNKLSVLTELHRSEGSTAVVARKDRGIKNAKDLIGKSIAAVSKTNAEFLLHLYLRSNLIQPKQVQIKHMAIDEAVSSVRSGRVDAAALWEPYVSQSIAGPQEFVLLKSPYYSEFSMLVGLRDTLNEKQQAPYAVLRALQRAADFYQQDPVKARQIVDGFLQKRGVFTSAGAWNEMDIHLGLSSTLLTMFTEEVNIFNPVGAQYIRPEMIQLMHGNFLKAVAPHLVTYE